MLVIVVLVLKMSVPAKMLRFFFSFLFFVERISTGLREYVCEYFFSVVWFNYIASVCVRTPKIKRVHAYALYTIVVDVFVRDWLSQNWISSLSLSIQFYTCLNIQWFDVWYFFFHLPCVECLARLPLPAIVYIQK